MRNGNIPLPYQVILRKLWSLSYIGVVEIKSARTMLGWYFRMGKHNWTKIYCEMRKKGYVRHVGNRQGLKILIPLKDLV
ncbi:hypothetical protein LCGC14_0438990 [marine sediment metagenome]|uniref:Uncharacterized protein n=1 Tax=marine sediment metagenome TaxID=412755 RepID=A0A0F9V7S1_9ZZZZ